MSELGLWFHLFVVSCVFVASVLNLRHSWALLALARRTNADRLRGYNRGVADGRRSAWADYDYARRYSSEGFRDVPDEEGT